MELMRRSLLRYVAALASFFFAAPASAHEVYVLDHATIVRDMALQSPNPFGAVWENEYRFFFWAFVSVVTVLTVFCVSLFHASWLDRLLGSLKRYAPVVTRVTLGVCLIACAQFQGLFGPELPLHDFVGAYAPYLRDLLFALGALALIGLFTRTVALIALAIFALSIARYGSYMLTYANYLGEMLITLILGGGIFSIDQFISGKRLPELARRFEPYAFLLARVGFGVAVMFAAFYAKFLHSQLAVDTVVQYHLTNYFPFPPLFVVLGALIIETLIGLFFILGIEVRWTALFFLFWLALSLWYFGEVVWPHLILIGLNFALIAHGYDRYTLESWVLRRRKAEPVL